MRSRTTVLLFPRNRYLGGTAAKAYLPRDREKIARMLGTATRVSVHARVYDRSGTGAILDFEVSQGAFADEMPAEGARMLTLTASGQTPSLPWNNTNMTAMPDDGTFYVSPTLMLVDIAAKVSGGAGVWVEFEVYAVAEYNT